MLLPYWNSAVVVEEAMVSYLATLSQCTGISAHPRNTLFTGTPNNYLAVFCFFAYCLSYYSLTNLTQDVQSRDFLLSAIHQRKKDKKLIVLSAKGAKTSEGKH